MKNFKVGLSLRYKLLFLLVTIPILSLGLYLAMATDLFKEDKVAYVYDSSATVSRSLATQVRMEVQTAYATVRSAVENFDFTAQDFNASGKDFFNKNPRLHAIVLYRRDGTGRYVKLGQMAKESAEAQKFIADDQLLNSIRAQAVEDTAFVSEHAGLPGAVRVAFRLGEHDEQNHMVVEALYQADEMLNAFDGANLYSSLVLTRNGAVAMGGTDVPAGDLKVLHGTLTSKANEGTGESKLTDGKTYLVSYSAVGMGDMVVISKVDKDKALKAVEVLIAKSFHFFVALFASTLVISVFASNKLTAAIRELFDATGKIAAGDFNVRVQPRSKDEVGGLAESFNFMAAEVERLMKDTAEKARMEGELSTVRTVQETLFPASQSQFGPLRIKGHFEPASECGGDWWSYSRIGNKIFLYIGDATGHGAPAALITSAATSAAAVIESMPDITPAKAMTILNRAIHQTSKGSIMMTFFVAAIDLDQGTFTYACASHDPPYLMRKTGEKLGRKDLMPLNEVNGPRLGDRKDFVYDEKTVEFYPGDLVFFYTDGILDIQDLEGKKWGERNFLKSLLDSSNTGEDADAKIEQLRAKLNSFRNGSNLIDDVTMVMCEYERPAA
jgi:sigma-B regulation protein RsbU (phosphoserine phosphatase)